MSRNKLHFSDQVLIDYLYEGFKVKALTLHFIEVGSFYGFVVDTTNKDKKYFLKVYPKHQSKVPIHPTMDSLNQTGIALNRFKNEFGLNNISYMLPNFDGNYCFETQLQRFFEDCRYYLEQVLHGKNKTMQQSEEDKDAFSSHWGWSICLK